MKWWNDYIGIPYAEKGRERAGLDCWGLLRLVYAEQFDIDLPSFAEEYELDERERIADLIAANKEGWARVDVVRSGDAVLFSMLGNEAHVGVVTQPGFFLHVREGQDSVIERLDSGQWKHRVRGIFRYTENAALTLAACPHPLKTMRIDTQMPAGLNLAQMAQVIRDQNDIAEAIPADAIITVDGEVVHKADWELCYPTPGARVEYRAVATGGGIGRIFAMIAIMVVAWYVAPYLVAGGGQFGSLGWGALTTAQATTATMVMGMVNMAGQMLFNAIFPVRPPSLGMGNSDYSGPESMPLMLGAKNQANRFGAIPVALGRSRYVAPLGANSYVESGGNISYLRMLLVWGYGPLQISDLRVNDTPLDAYHEVEYETLSGYGDSEEAMGRFNSLYGQDVAQENVNSKLESFRSGISRATRSSGVVTVVTSQDHNLLYGMEVRLYSGGIVASGTVKSVIDSRTFTFDHAGADGRISCSYLIGSAWTERTISSECDRISVSLYFGQGLFGMSKRTGNTQSRTCVVSVQLRQVGETSWSEVAEVVQPQSINLVPAWYNVDDDAALEPVYRWTRISLDKHNQIIVRQGAFTTDPNSAPSGNLLTRLQNDNFGLDASFDLLPFLGESEEELWRICMYGDSVHSYKDMRSDVTGCDLSIDGRVATLSSGTITRAQTETVTITKASKKAFSHNVSFYVPHGEYEVRVRRTNNNTYYSDTTYDGCHLQTVTGYSNNKPVNPPQPLAMTAIRVKATNQLNGNIDGIAATVQTICKDYDADSGTWIVRPTRNPASLFRHIMQHPANAQRKSDEELDIAGLEDWHKYCQENGWTYNAVLTSQKSLDEVRRDVAAAGRASPTVRDGKWTVIIDRPRDIIAQHFTPHNSWGFEAEKSLPKLPHAFRVSFNNEEKGYQADERIVYADGYSSDNATLFEGLKLPGVTNSDAVFKHARFHLAQLKLRPETYTINADIEHLVCTRGDLVRVTHDVPMWGVGTGRIKNFIDATHIEIDEVWPMEAGEKYTVRIRLADGSSITRSVVPVTVDDEYSVIELTESITEAEGEAGNLVLFGAVDAESVELVVLSVEPSKNMAARITLTDYSPAVYDSDTETIPPFDSQITKPAGHLGNIIPNPPTITEVASDESVMLLLSPGQYANRIRVSYANPASLPSRVSYVEAQIDSIEDTTDDWQRSFLVPVQDGTIFFDGVDEGSHYRIRIRYLDDLGRTSKWAVVDDHLVLGKMALPADVTEFLISDGVLTWSEVSVFDLAGYAVRFHYGANTSWGTATPLHNGLLSTSPYKPDLMPAGEVTLMIKAVDTSGNESENATVIHANFGDAPVENLIYTYDDQAAGFPGDKVNCSVVYDDSFWDEDKDAFWGAGDANYWSPPIYELQADDSGDLFWGDGEVMFWGADGATYWPTATYKAMIYTTKHLVHPDEAGSRLKLGLDVAAEAYTVEYRYDALGLFWGADDDFFWDEDAAFFWPVPTEWQTWLGGIEDVAEGIIELRITTQSGVVRGTVSKLEFQFDVQDEAEVLDDVSISASGTRLPLAKAYRSIKNIQLTLQADGGAAVAAMLSDKSIEGPLIYCFDSTGAPTTGLIDARVRGVKGR